MSAPAVTEVRVRRRLRIEGVVQGVGFRPFVHRVATGLGLSGHVGNDPEGVFAEVEGPPGDVERFLEALRVEAPPLARILAIEATAIAPCPERGFRIVESVSSVPGRTLVCPDVATCDDCLRELLDPGDRRYRYPFTNCTNCGPRFTITVRLPYDRANTTMADFEMCPRCAAEYHDPADRRFHAQPLACAACGPRLGYFDGTRTVSGTDLSLAGAHWALARGRILAVKGLGGYHLACDATSESAVGRLRRAKHRADKPLAVMVADLEAACRVAEVGPEEAALLGGPSAPIVLVRRREGTSLSASLAPGNPYLGVMLAYTPLHHLLFLRVPGNAAPAPPGALVMTSGNLSEEPICYDDAEAQLRLGGIADAWLLHNRPIHVPCDDSVLRIDEGHELPIRRSRGYAPLPVRLPFAVAPSLATGGELKNTFCLAQGRHAWLSQHLGDMGSLETLRAFTRSARQFEELYEVRPGSAATDAHPGYQTRRWAEGTFEQVDLVQHHHAHVAAVMAEHNIAEDQQVIGVAFDGTGYGDDGAIWGGEVLVAGYGSFERRAHLSYVWLPGGDATVTKPYRAALAHLFAAGIGWGDDLAPVRAAPRHALVVVGRQLERGVECVATSSMGRLFDAVSSLLDVRHEASYEGQAAIELETLASSSGGAPRSYRFALAGGEIDAAPVLRAIVADLRAGHEPGAIAAGFHLAVAVALAEVSALISEGTGIGQVALTGGVFQNLLLLRDARAELAGRGLGVLTHRLVPPNDGGLALGQVVVAGHRRKEWGRP